MGVQGIGNDVTEAIWRADELTRFVATANAPIIGIDTDLRIVTWNRFTEKITGFTKQEAVGEKLVERFIDP